MCARVIDSRRMNTVVEEIATVEGAPQTASPRPSSPRPRFRLHFPKKTRSSQPTRGYLNAPSTHPYPNPNTGLPSIAAKVHGYTSCTLQELKYDPALKGNVGNGADAMFATLLVHEPGWPVPPAD